MSIELIRGSRSGVAAQRSVINAARQVLQKRTEFALVAALVPLIGCAQSLDPELAERLRSDIAAISKEIEAGEQEDAKYAGGLVKSLVGARLAILRQTKAMLTQREKAWAFGVGLTYTIDGEPFVSPADSDTQLADVAAEIESLDKKIKSEEQDAARYSGGLVLAMKLSAIGTMRQTRAMLQQKRMSLQYALPQYLPFVKASEVSTGGSPPAELPGEPSVEIVSIDTKVTESNNAWSKYAWKLTLKNPTEATGSYVATIEFLDSDGFVVDDATVYDLIITPGEERVFTGYELVDASVAGNISSVGAKVRGR